MVTDSGSESESESDSGDSEGKEDHEKKIAEILRDGSYIDRLQNNETNGTHCLKLPSNPDEEGGFQLRLCLDYMNIIDKILVDFIPKNFIMMLVMKLIDFLKGGG